MDSNRYVTQDDVKGFHAERRSSIAKLMNSNVQRSGINKIHSGYSNKLHCYEFKESGQNLKPSCRKVIGLGRKTGF